MKKQDVRERLYPNPDPDLKVPGLLSHPHLVAPSLNFRDRVDDSGLVVYYPILRVF